VVSGLASTWGKIFIVARRLSQAQQVADELAGIAPQGAAGPGAPEIVPLPYTAAALREAAIGCHLIVNTTPVGMAPATDGSPWPDEVPIPASAAVYDLVYNPRETAFIRLARLAGVPAVGGLGMLIEQAALSFERWTGQPASRQAMRAAVSDHRGTL
jgi:shikimate dehydrogenase